MRSCRGGPQSSLMFCTNGVLLRMLTHGDGLQDITHVRFSRLVCCQTCCMPIASAFNRQIVLYGVWERLQYTGGGNSRCCRLWDFTVTSQSASAHCHHLLCAGGVR